MRRTRLLHGCECIAAAGKAPSVYSSSIQGVFTCISVEINFSDRQEGLTVSSIICDR